jgi:hypothetical protein
VILISIEEDLRITISEQRKVSPRDNSDCDVEFEASEAVELLHLVRQWQSKAYKMGDVYVVGEMIVSKLNDTSMITEEYATLKLHRTCDTLPFEHPSAGNMILNATPPASTPHAP